jgi:hypothetical protein
MTPPLRWGQRVQLSGGDWGTIVSTVHPHRPGCWVWRSGEINREPEIVADRLRGHVEPTLPATGLPPAFAVCHASVGGDGPPDGWRDESGVWRVEPPRPLTLPELDRELVRRARQGPYAIMKTRP